METKHEKGSGSGFLWGLVIGFILATLLTTKKGRLILKEVTGLGLELIEELIEDRKQAAENRKKEDLADLEEAGDDLASEVAEAEVPSKSDEEPEESLGFTEKGTIDIDEEPRIPVANFKEKAPVSNGNGHHKKRLFRGVRRK